MSVSWICVLPRENIYEEKSMAGKGRILFVFRLFFCFFLVSFVFVYFNSVLAWMQIVWGTSIRAHTKRNNRSNKTNFKPNTLLKLISYYYGIVCMCFPAQSYQCLYALIKLTFAQLYFSLLLLLWYCVSVCVHTKWDQCAECVPYSIVLRKVVCVCECVWHFLLIRRFFIATVQSTAAAASSPKSSSPSSSSIHSICKGSVIAAIYWQ